VQVGLQLPPVILAALRREVGARTAERLAVNGSLISPQEALRCGLVHELAAPDQVIDRAVKWCRDLLALPPAAMTATRQDARADLHELFRRNLDEEVETMSRFWSNKETQAALEAMVARLKKK